MLIYLTLIALLMLHDAPRAAAQSLRAEGISTEAPIAKLLNGSETGAITARLSRLLERLESHASEPQSANINHQCISGDHPWRIASNAFINERGWGRLRDRSCMTDFSNTLPLALHPRLFSDVRALQRLVDGVSTRAISATRRNWTHAEAPAAFVHTTSALTCSVDSVTAFRVLDVWHVTVSITNAPSMHYLRHGTRLFIEEYLSSVGTDDIAAARMSLPHRTRRGLQQRNDSTTLRSTWDWAGAVIPVKFGRVMTEDIPAVRLAQRDAGVHVQQIEAALSTSNVAILALPLCLTLVPLALVTEVGTLGTVLYALLSDVLPVLPMAIKGAEIVAASTAAFRSVVVRLAPVLPNRTVAAEMWLADCALRGVRGKGIALLVVAVVMCVVGLALEIAAVWYVQRRVEGRVRRQMPCRLAQTLVVQSGVFMKTSVWTGECGGMCDGACVREEHDGGRQRRKRKRALVY